MVQGKSILGKIEEPVFIHFEFDNWEPTVMKLAESEKNTWKQVRMIPPGKVQYFITHAGVPDYCRDVPRETRESLLQLKDIEFLIDDPHFEERK